MNRIASRISSLLPGERAIFGILLVGLVLRLIGAENRGIQYDDAFTILLSQESLGKIISGTAADTMPPLYYWMLHFWMLLGKDIWFIRLLSIGLNLLTVYVFYRLVKLLFDRSTALWAALLAAIAPLQLYHAQDIRMYSLLLLAQTAFIYFFVKIWKRTDPGERNTWDWLWLVVSGAVAMYTHNLAVFAIVIPDAFLLLRKKWRLLSQLVIAQIGIAALALPWLIQLPGQFTKVQRAWTLPRPGILEIVQAIIMFTGSLPLPWVLMVIVTLLSLQIFAVVVIETIRQLRKNDENVLLLACIALLPPIILFALSYVMQPVFIPRGFLVSSLAYYGLAGFIISKSWSRRTGAALAAVFTFAVVLSLPSYYAFDQFPRSPFREAAQYLNSEIQPGDVVVHDNKLSYFPTYVYAKDLPQAFLADPPNSANDTLAPGSQQAMDQYPADSLEVSLADAKRVWYVVFDRTIDEYKSMGKPGHPNLEWLDSHLQRRDQASFEDLEVILYER